MRIENLDKNTNKLRYFIAFSYNGASFFGFQIQPNEISVQETLEKALSVLLREDIKITGAGRTDTGVHAKKMYAHFETSNEPGDQLVHKLNSFYHQVLLFRKSFRYLKICMHDLVHCTELMNTIFR